MDVRIVVLDRSARADRPDRGAFGDRVAAADVRRSEMRQGHRIAVRRLDRHRSPADGNGARERNRSRCRREHGCPGRGADVDSSMLARGIGVVTEDEGLENRAFDRPRPGTGGRGGDEGGRERNDQGSTHFSLLVVLIANRSPRYLERRLLSIWTTGSCRTSACAEVR
jgi:hypothetical protein